MDEFSRNKLQSCVEGSLSFLFVFIKDVYIHTYFKCMLIHTYIHKLYGIPTFLDHPFNIPKQIKTKAEILKKYLYKTKMKT